jgi:hypothetical protein
MRRLSRFSVVLLSVAVIIIMIVKPQTVVAHLMGQPKAAEPPRPVHLTAGEVIVTFPPDSFWCTAGCVSLAAWQGMDAQLQAGLTIAYHYTPAWRVRARAAMAFGTTFSWATLSRYWGTYSPSEHLIRIDTQLQDEPLSVLAAVLAHEVNHAADAADAAATGENAPWAETAATCLAGEMASKRWSAMTYQAVARGDERTDGAQYYQWLVQQWQQGRVQAHVLETDIYQANCMGSVLPDY